MSNQSNLDQVDLNKSNTSNTSADLNTKDSCIQDKDESPELQEPFCADSAKQDTSSLLSDSLSTTLNISSAQPVVDSSNFVDSKDQNALEACKNDSNAAGCSMEGIWSKTNASIDNFQYDNAQLDPFVDNIHHAIAMGDLSSPYTIAPPHCELSLPDTQNYKLSDADLNLNSNLFKNAQASLNRGKLPFERDRSLDFTSSKGVAGATLPGYGSIDSISQSSSVAGNTLQLQTNQENEKQDPLATLKSAWHSASPTDEHYEERFAEHFKERLGEQFAEKFVKNIEGNSIDYASGLAAGSFVGSVAGNAADAFAENAAPRSNLGLAKSNQPKVKPGMAIDTTGIYLTNEQDSTPNYYQDGSRTEPLGLTVPEHNQAYLNELIEQEQQIEQALREADDNPFFAASEAQADLSTKVNPSTFFPHGVFNYINSVTEQFKKQEDPRRELQTKKISTLLDNYILAPRYESLPSYQEFVPEESDDPNCIACAHLNLKQVYATVEKQDNFLANTTTNLDEETTNIHLKRVLAQQDASLAPINAGATSTPAALPKADAESLSASGDSVEKEDKAQSLAHFLTKVDKISFTNILPVSSYQGMTQVKSQDKDSFKANVAKEAELIVPHLTTANSYKQVSTDEPFALCSADEYLEQSESSASQEIFSSLSLQGQLNSAYDPDKADRLNHLSASFAKTNGQIEPTKIQKTEMVESALKDPGPNLSFFARRSKEADSHAIISDIPSLWFTDEINETLNYVIQHHDKYRLDNNHKELLSCVGNWCFDREEGGFFIDKACAKLLGIENPHKALSLKSIASLFKPQDVEKILYNFTHVEAGMIFSDRLKVISGPYAGINLVAQGSATLRDPETGIVMIASGFLCYEYSPQADFLFRELLGDGTFVWSAESDRTHSSPSYHAMLGYTKDEFPDTFTDFCNNLVHPDDDEPIVIQNHIVRTPHYGDSFEACLRLKHKDGHYIWTIGRGLVLERNSKGVATKLIGSQSNINLVHKSFENIGSLMFTDSLTELYNRSYFMQNAVRYEQRKNHPLTVIFVDVTGLKLTNDILGHNHGDFLILKCVVCIMRALQKILSKFDLFSDYRDQLHNSIDNLTLKAFELIFQNKDDINNTSKIMIEQGNNLNQFVKSINIPQAASFADFHKDIEPSLVLSPEAIEKILKQKIRPELIRLAGDELLLLFPNCPIALAQQLEKEICLTQQRMNAVDKLNFPRDQLPVPLCFGIGTATVGEAGEETPDSFKQALDRADMRMLQNKEELQKESHNLLKAYFEQRLHRKVSMRDSRREEVLSEQERQALREQIMKQRQAQASAEQGQEMQPTPSTEQAPATEFTAPRLAPKVAANVAAAKAADSSTTPQVQAMIAAHAVSDSFDHLAN